MAETRRIYAPAAAFSDGGLLLEGERLRHLRTVLRLRPGDEFAVTDGRGAEYLARVERLGRDAGRAAIVARAEPRREPPCEITLAQALPRGDRFAFVLEKSVELGVGAIQPLLSGRTVREGGQVPPRERRGDGRPGPETGGEVTRDGGAAPSLRAPGGHGRG